MRFGCLFNYIAFLIQYILFSFVVEKRYGQKSESYALAVQLLFNGKQLGTECY